MCFGLVVKAMFFLCSVPACWGNGGKGEWAGEEAAGDFVPNLGASN